MSIAPQHFTGMSSACRCCSLPARCRSLTVGGVRLMLTHPEKPEFDHPSSVLYFAVPDIAAAHRQMLNSGVRFEGEPHLIARMPNHDLWMAFFRDSEENLLALMCELPMDELPK
jgi:hypothetical protein